MLMCWQLRQERYHLEQIEKAVMAIKTSDIIELESLLTRGLSPHADLSSRHKSLLHLSACMESSEPLKCLLRNGANPNATDRYGNTPLHVVCELDSTEKARVLLDAGANPNVNNAFGSSPLHICARLHGSKMTNILLSAGCQC
jgi:ankyrin repeat protein